MTKVNCSNFEWNIENLCYRPTSNYAILILTTGLESNEDNNHIRELWKKASVRVCVDGGTNEFYSYIQHNQYSIKSTPNYSFDAKETKIEGKNAQKKREAILCKDIPIPDIISGDFDSIDHDVLEFYRKAGSEIISTPDQNETDFTKALLVLGDNIAKHELQINHVIAIAGINSSRFDHILAHMNTLYKVKGLLTYPVIIISGSSLVWLLDPGIHQIHIPSSIVRNKEKSWCGYASLSGPVTVSTTGLKWDIDNKTVAFGQAISTSNTYCDQSDGVVTVRCSDNLLWCMGWDQM